MPEFVEAVKCVAAQTWQAQKPVAFSFGRVTAAAPLSILVDQKLPLPGSFFLIPERLTDHQVEVSVGWETSTDGTHPHNHRVAGRRTMTVHGGLRVGDKLLLLAVQQGQKYLIIDRVV